MTIRSPRWLTIAIVLAAAALTAALVVVATRSTSPQLLSDKSGAQTITAPDGTRLSAYAYVPNGDGPFPLIVMPASWGAAATEYANVANGYAVLGYVVVAYAQRGFDASTGTVDLAGPGSQSDVSTVITWALANTPAAASKVGVVGASYGAGVALLAAERDSRIKAVVALSGWTDLAATLAPGGTLSAQDYTSLLAVVPTDRMSGEMRTFVGQLKAKDLSAAMATLRKLSPSRSPITGVAKLNKWRTAVMMGDAYQDSLLPPGSAVTFFDALTAPKRLELAVGDHAGPALSGLLGHKNALWENAAKWTDVYLNGGDNGIEKQPPLQLQDVTTNQVHGYAGWAAAGHATALHLTGVSGGAGQLSASASPAWSRTITAGVDTIADAGPQQFTTGKPYQEPTASIARISPAAGIVWDGPAVIGPTLVSGVARVHAAVRISAGTGSLFGYLYDVDASGSGRLMTHGTVTVRGVDPSTAHDLDIVLEPISWTVAAGHHISLVIDTVDPRYLGESVKASTVTVSSSAADPATLEVPLG